MPGYKRCINCHKKFWANRDDAIYCNNQCMLAKRKADRKAGPKISSGIEGIVYDRESDKWIVRIKIEGKWKYVGRVKSTAEAIKLQEEYYK